MKEIANEMVEKLKLFASQNKTIEIHEEFQKLTLKVIAATAFGLDNPKLPIILESFHFLSEQLNNILYFIPGSHFLRMNLN